MMTIEEITAQTNSFLADEFEVDPADIREDADLKQVLDLDSLDYIDLVVVIENNFHFKVKPEDLSGIRSFQDLYQYILSRVNQKATA
jgi:acyl carrier protein